MKSLDLHDGSLDGIAVVKPDALELRCRDVHGQRYVLRLNGLTRLRADNFREGNIIFELVQYDHDFPVDLVRRVYGEDGQAEPPWLESCLNDLQKGGWTLLLVTSSYGCELLALAKDKLSVEKVDE